MDYMYMLEIALRYAIAPLIILAWHMYKKLETRVERIEQKTSDIEKAIIEIKTEFKYISKDIQIMRDALVKLSDR